MREILFRAQAINREEGREYRTNYKNGDWVYGLLTRHEDKYSCATMTNEDGISNIDIAEQTLGQYTGLKDKNGKKIFEGDILEFDFHDIGKQKAVVYYNEKYCAFLLNVITAKFEYATICDGIVIGNIYDNLELLGGDNAKN